MKNNTLNFWQLACVSGLVLGLPAMVVGGQIEAQYGAGTAIISVCIGNAILWLIGLAILSMTEGKNHAIENVRNYLGKNISILIALTWILAFLMFYVIQINGATSAVSAVIPHIKSWKIGITLGLFTAIASFGGIRLIKWCCVVALPLLFAFSIYAMISTPSSVSFKNSWGVSFSAVLTIVWGYLPSMVNLPTLFRHSKSKDDSILGLSLMTVIHAFFLVFTIFLGITAPKQMVSIIAGHSGIILLFAILAYLCVNLMNIYYASAGWETIVFRHKSPKEYIIVGVIGTGVYLLFDILRPFSLGALTIEFLLVNFIANLGVVLVIDFIIRTIVKHRPRPLEKFWSTICWLIGCGTSLIVQIQASERFVDTLAPLYIGMLSSALTFLIILFIEETIWSIKKLPKKTSFLDS